MLLVTPRVHSFIHSFILVIREEEEELYTLQLLSCGTWHRVWQTTWSQIEPTGDLTNDDNMIMLKVVLKTHNSCFERA